MPRLLVQALFPQLMAAGAFGPQAAGLIMMGQSATAIAVILLFPAIVRLVSLNALILTGGLLSASGIAGVALDPRPWSMAIAFSLVGGMGWALFSLRTPQEAANLLPAEGWPRNMAAITRGPLIASLVVPTLALGLSAAIDWRWILSGTAFLLLVGAVVGFIALSGLKSPPHVRHTESISRCAQTTLVPAMSMCLSGYIAGLFHTHLIIIASSGGRSTPDLMLWSAAYGVLTVVAVSLWTIAIKRSRLSASLMILAGIAAAAGVLTASTPSSSGSLTVGILWSVLSVGLYMDAMRTTAASSHMRTRVTGILIILHMACASAGALVSGVVAEAGGSYSGALYLLSLLSIIYGMSRALFVSVSARSSHP